ncbi:MAG: ankyrin repeat domain-containing protein [Thermoguttaceae bacterium]|nr:ankyrin repeat domain-containing protein [Thermoguttaceae bacterium]
MYFQKTTLYFQKTASYFQKTTPHFPENIDSQKTGGLRRTSHLPQHGCFGKATELEKKGQHGQTVLAVQIAPRDSSCPFSYRWAFPYHQLVCCLTILFLSSIEAGFAQETKNFLYRSRQLAEAIEANDLNTVRQMITETPTLLNQPDAYGLVPLVRALGNVECYSDCEEDCEDCNSTPMEPWFRPEEVRPEIAKWLIQAGANLHIHRRETGNAWDDGQTLFYLGVQSGAADVVKLLIEKGADVHQCNRDQTNNHTGDTDPPIVAAVSNGSVEIFQTLLDAGVKWNPKVEAKKPYTAGLTMLHYASFGGRTDLMRQLIQAGADIESRGIDKWGGATPLQMAAEYGGVEAVEVLLDAGADIETRDYQGCTPIFRAVLCPNPDVVRRLLAAGAKINLYDDSGFTPLHYFLLMPPDDMLQPAKRLETLRILLDAGADPNMPMQDDTLTPLEAATPTDRAVVKAYMKLLQQRASD